MLSIDDAFAGGVCRCQFCGTIQTVPRPSPKNSQAAADVSSPKALFKRKARIESALSPYNDGLARAVDEMESSGGLSSGALAGLSAGTKHAASADGENAAEGISASASQPNTASPRRSTATAAPSSNLPATGRRMVATVPPAPSTPPVGKTHFVPKPSSAAASAASAAANKSSNMPIILAAAAIGVMVCTGGLWWAVSGGSSKLDQAAVAAQAVPAPVAKAAPAIPVAVPKAAPEPTSAPAAAAAVPAPKPASAPSDSGALGGITFSGPGVVYIVDRSGCTPQAFRQMLDACYGSIQSLGQDRKFALIIWNNSQDLAFPQQNLAPASVTNLEECRKLAGDSPVGATDIGAILSKAVASKPDDIVLMSAADLDNPTATAIREQLAKTMGIRFHGIAVGTGMSAERLRPLVADYAGQFVRVDLVSLK